MPTLILLVTAPDSSRLRARTFPLLGPILISLFQLRRCAKRALLTLLRKLMVSANSAIRLMGLPSLDLWEVVLGRKIALDLIEDNESTVLIIKIGKHPTMSHMPWPHGVNVMWFHYVYHKGVFGMM